jgi:Icc-related predicted phosphoesterase
MEAGKRKIRFVCMSDSHTQTPSSLPEGDILIHAGDWSNNGSTQDLIKFCDFIAKAAQKYKHVVVIAGNHDWCAEEKPQLTQEYIESAGAVYLNDEGVVLENIKIWGSPITPWFFDWAFNRHRGQAIQKHWDMIPQDTEVLITHGPPYGIGDQLGPRGSEPFKHVGCANLTTTIDQSLKKLKLHVFGHIHEGHGVFYKSGTTYVNASILDERYTQKYEPTVVEIEV